MDDLELARELADIAAAIALRYFATHPETSIKQDGTLVTIADREIEQSLRDRLSATRPHHAVLGEEEGLIGNPKAPVWIIDPIDGTNNFAAGVPIFATLIALRVEGRTEIGVASAPALGERYEAARGGGASMNGKEIRVSDVASLDQATVCFGSNKRMIKMGYASQLSEILTRCRRDRGFGDFWGHMLVARGAVEMMAEPSLAIWDVAALEVIVEEAGGKMTGFTGNPYPESRLLTKDGEPSCLSTNGLLHDEMIRMLKQPSIDS
ncbi:MAG TPA: inositol monophosphatase family protein [Actinomycetota bacterium]|nr:inositol monophosphatase family protein [Actinomycetota bacterium]